MSFSKTLVRCIFTDHSATLAALEDIHHRDDLLLVCSANMNGQSPFARLPEHHSRLSEARLPCGTHLSFVHCGFTVYAKDDERQGSRSSLSGAQYLAEWQVGRTCYLLQYLPPHTRTSTHHHEGTVETHIGIHGWCAVRQLPVGHSTDRAISRQLGTTSQLVTPMHTVHQSRTKDQPFIGLIVMERVNARGLQHPTDMSDHHPAEFSLFP